MKMHRMITALLLAVFLAAGIALAEMNVPDLETDIADIQKHGNIDLEISASDLLAQGYEYGDLVTVTINGQTMDMPLGSNYSDVDSGDMVCRAEINETDDKVTLAINMGDMATTLGIAAKTTIDEDPGYRWDFSVDEPVAVGISMKEKGGYADEYMIHQLTGSIERADYPNLTDEEYANFRNIATTGMGKGILYRSSSPVNPKINRAKEADEALNNACVRTIMNLADTRDSMESYEDYSYSYYSQRDIIPLNLDMDFNSDETRSKLAEGLEYFSSHEGPYLVHCNEGKDRAGFVSALLECLMGASVDEVVADYMVTYYNYYGVEPGSEQYDVIVRSNIAKTLADVFGIEDIYTADLALCADAYVHAIGLADDTVKALKNNLGKSFTD